MFPGIMCMKRCCYCITYFPAFLIGYNILKASLCCDLRNNPSLQIDWPLKQIYDPSTTSWTTVWLEWHKRLEGNTELVSSNLVRSTTMPTPLSRWVTGTKSWDIEDCPTYPTC